MEKPFRFTFIIVFAFIFISTSCRKKKTEDETTAPEANETSVFAEQSKDITTSDDNFDLSMDEVEGALNNSGLAGAKGQGISEFSICGAVVDSSALVSAKTLSITYNGATCNGLKSRTGTIIIKLVYGNKWKDQGSVISITYLNYKVTLLSTNKSNTLNGIHYITNVSGGLVPRLGISPNPATIVRKIRSSNMSITFDDGTMRTWSVAKSRTWTGIAGQSYTLTLSGDTTLNGNLNTEIWGTNRAGNYFTTVTTVPIVFAIPCVGPVSGKKTHYFNSRVSTITFGTDANGNIASPSTCPNHYLINWTSLSNVPKTYIGTY